MGERQNQLTQLIQLIDDFDTFGKQSKQMSLLSVAVGTLRKDRSIATDIVSITSTNSDGLGALALSRILIEDYLHLLYLDSDHSELPQRLDDFNSHPHIEHYSSIQTMNDWGFDLGNPEEVKTILDQVNKGFEQHKHKFLRRKHAREPFDADDYFRTWTKVSLNELITKAGIPSEAGDKKNLQFMTQTYDTASAIIHHNAFIIWFLANQGTKLLRDEYPDLALTISFISLSRTLNLVIKIARDEAQDDTKYGAEQTRLADVMESFVVLPR